MALKKNWIIFLSACVLAALTLAPSHLQESGNYDSTTEALFRYIRQYEGSTSAWDVTFFRYGQSADFRYAALEDLGESDRGGLNELDRLRLVDLWVLSQDNVARVLQLPSVMGAPSPLHEFHEQLDWMLAGVLGHEEVQLRLFKSLAHRLDEHSFSFHLMILLSKYEQICVREEKPFVIYLQVRESIARVLNTQILRGDSATQPQDDLKQARKNVLRLSLVGLRIDDDRIVVAGDLVSRRHADGSPQIKVIKSHSSRSRRIEKLIQSASFSRMACEGLFW